MTYIYLLVRQIGIINLSRTLVREREVIQIADGVTKIDFELSGNGGNIF